MKIISNLSEKKELNLNKQRAVRERFKMAMGFLVPLNSLIQMGLRRVAKRKTAMGYAMSHLLKYAFTGEYPAMQIDPSKVLISRGPLCVPLMLEVERKGPWIDLTWSLWMGRIANGDRDDELVLCAYSIEQGIAGINEIKALRTDGALRLLLPSDLEDEPVHLYLMVHDRDKKFFSNSHYLGSF